MNQKKRLLDLERRHNPPVEFVMHFANELTDNGDGTYTAPNGKVIHERDLFILKFDVDRGTSDDLTEGER